MTTLFDPLPLPAAKADPATSKAAARALIMSGTRDRQLAQTLWEVRKFPGLTSLELAGRCGLDRYQLARRLPELEKLGLVRKGPARRCVSGRLAVVWNPT